MAQPILWSKLYDGLSGFDRENRPEKARHIQMIKETSQEIRMFWGQWIRGL